MPRVATKSTCLATLYPEVAAQWHPTKNGDLTPDQVTAKSGQKVWWQCPRVDGHIWKAIVASRTSGIGCPGCSGKMAFEDNCLANVRPDIAAQWHPTKNTPLTPQEVTLGSNKKVWWKCKEGRDHEWQTTVNSRTGGNHGCPVCAGRMPSSKNNLAVNRPKIAATWHPSKNGSLSPSEVTSATHRTVWWLCGKGHSWEAPVYKRTSGQNCPYCSGRRVGKDNNVALLNPRLAKQWLQSKNGDLTPDQVTQFSHKKVWWVCEKGHEWQELVSARSKGLGCPYCSGRRVAPDNNLAVLYPHLVKEWHPTKNASLTADQVRPGSHQKVWWLCKEGHEWLTSIASRSNGSGCHICQGYVLSAGTSLAGINPGLAKYWHIEKNRGLSPSEVFPNSQRKIWWFCDKGHEWKASLANRSKGQGCPYCSGRRVGPDNNLAFKNPDLASEWHPEKNESLTANKVTPGSSKKVWWKCKQGHEWSAVVASRSKGIGCPYCTNQSSRAEIRIYAEVKGLFHQTKHRERLDGLELDVYLPDYKIAIEYDGYYYHRNSSDRDEHKNEQLASQGVTLIRMRESPLDRLSESDVVCGRDRIEKSDIDNLLAAIGTLLNADDLAAAEAYRKRTTFQSQKLYRRLLSYFPNPLPTTSFAELKPDAAKFWHPTKNRPLTPDQFTPSTRKKVWWLCEKGHEWKSAIMNLSRGSRCPYCSGNLVTNVDNLAVKMPEVARQWHPRKNGALTPQDVKPGSGKKAWWICEKGHEWEAIIYNRKKGRGCPYCSGRYVGKDNSLAALHPDIAAEWHPSKNADLAPDKVFPGSNKKVWWKCSAGHEWQKVVYDRRNGSSCPQCRDNNHS